MPSWTLTSDQEFFQDAFLKRVGTTVPQTISDGQKIVGTPGVRERLLPDPTPCKKLDIVALSTNVGTVVIGGATCVANSVTRRGFPLAKGDSYMIEINDVSKVYIDATSAGDGVSFVYSY